MADFLLSVGLDVGLSYEQMRKDISSLVSQLNSNPPKIKLAFDIDKAVTGDLRTQIEKISSAITTSGDGADTGGTHKTANKITQIANEAKKAAVVQVTSAKKAIHAEEQHNSSLRQVLNTYREMLAAMRTNTNASTTSTYSELAEQAELLGNALELAKQKAITIDNALKQVGLNGDTAIENAKTALAAFRAEIERTNTSGTVSMKQLYATVASIQKLLNNNASFKNSSNFTALESQVSLLTQAINLAVNGGIALSEALRQVGLDGSNAIADAQIAMSAFKAELSGASIEEGNLQKDTESYRAALSKVNTLLASVTSNAEKWTAARHGSSEKYYEKFSQQADELKKLSSNLQAGTISAQDFNETYNRIKGTTIETSTAIRDAGENTQTWTARIGKLSEKFGTWFGITHVIMTAFRTVRKMVTAVVELDTAMTELKKVTDETDAAYEKFLVDATKRAKQLGAALSDTVTATADFARLGYNIQEAEKLADAAIIYKNVGDGIEDISDASESIIATMQAFGDEVNPEDIMSIVDKFNEVGNNYAISSKGVGDALLRSAAAMQAANNSLDDTIALATAANTVVQDPEKVGTTLKTVSMYLRAAKTEAEDAGESTEGMASSVSKLREEILALTGSKVDIQIDED